MNATGLLALFGFQLLGEAIAALLGLSIPGPVIGLLLLFAALVAYGEVPPLLERASQAMIGALPLLLIVPSAGLFFLGAGFRDQWPAFLAAVVGGTVLTLLFCALLMKLTMGKRGD